jgi:hypothetical protein
MNFVKSFGKFWYDFIIGDDWKIAVAVVSALVVTYALMAGTALGDGVLALLGGLLIVAFFSASLAIDVRPTKK